MRWVLALAALGFAVGAAAPPAGRADERGAAAEVAVPATEERSAAATSPAADATAAPWWRPSAEGPWRFTVAGWGWLPEIALDSKLDHQDFTLPIDLGTIIDDLQYGAMLDFEVRKGKFGAYVAPIFVGLKDTEHVQGLEFDHKVTVDDIAYLTDFGLSYEVGRWHLWDRSNWILPSPAVAVEPFVGARWLIDDIKVKLEPGRTFKTDIDFIAPVLGLRTFWDLTDRLNLRIEGDYGGFNVDHLKQTYNALGAVGWRFKPRQDLHINVFAGYRYLYVQYEKVAELKVTIRGPLVGLAFEFAANGSGFVSPDR